jgi:peroxiredoxin Q/BCP
VSQARFSLFEEEAVMNAGWDRAVLVAALVGLAVGLGWAVVPAAAADKDDEKKPVVGEPAPDINLAATQVGKVLPDKKDGKTLDLKELRGKNVVLYFFPKAMTPGCTIESCGFRDRIDDLARLDTVVIGISTDTLEKQEEFTKGSKLNFPLYADPDKKIAREYGVLNAERGVANRATFVIDKKGVLRKVYAAGTVNPKQHPEEVISYIKENLESK